MKCLKLNLSFAKEMHYFQCHSTLPRMGFENSLQDTVKMLGLDVNTEKIKYMCISWNDSDDSIL